jgi:hypothetical protein
VLEAADVSKEVGAICDTVGAKASDDANSKKWVICCTHFILPLSINRCEKDER